MPRKPNTPRTLDYFPPIYREVLIRVRDTGYLMMEFRSAREMHTMKFDFYRYFDSVAVHEKDPSLAAMAKLVRVKVDSKTCKMELESKVKLDSLNAVKDALQGSGERLDKTAESLKTYEQEMAELAKELEGKR